MPFSPPPASAHQLQGIDFSTATDFAAAAKHRFDAKDQEHGNHDPSLCKALLKFPGADGAVFWSSKMAIDADGPSAGPGRPPGSQLDPGPGQDKTSYKPYDQLGLPSETVPYIVLPQLAPHSSSTFDPAVALGDVAIVIFKDKITAAVCGDIGPFNKIGEASIAVHQSLMPACPDPCSQRDGQGHCVRTRNASVEKDVLFFVFPNSAFGPNELTAADINTKVKQRAIGLYNQLSGQNLTS
jgi:Fungal chitosanase of glycosyl hydrolase group 75